MRATASSATSTPSAPSRNGVAEPPEWLRAPLVTAPLARPGFLRPSLLSPPLPPRMPLGLIEERPPRAGAAGGVGSKLIQP